MTQTIEPALPEPERAPVTAPGPRVVAPPPPTIRVRHLWHRFGAFDVLRDVTFDVGPGEIFGFIGPNGAGKTTTIRAMATLLEPTAGRVEIDGVDVSIDPDEVRRRIGYMPDHAGVYERVTVREYLEFFADAFRVESLNVVDAVLELTDLGKLEDKLVVTMSKGMKQRLQLARILLHDPKVLILDEPASDLDPRARIEIRDLLLELRGLGKTIFLSSHILTELSDVCTSIGILERGRLMVAGPIGEIAARIEAIRAAQAVGHAPPPGHPYARAPVVPPPYASGGSHAAPAGHVHGAPPMPQASFGGVPMGGPPPGAPVGPAMAVGPGAAEPPAHPAGDAAAAPARIPVPVPLRRKVKVRVLGNPEMAAYLVRGGPGIVDAEVVGPVVHIGYIGGDVKIAEIVQHLVRSGVGVTGVEPERNELERIFLEVTRGEMQ